MASIGIAILALTLIIDGSIVRKLTDPSPVVQGLKEDIKADMTNSAGGLVTLALIMAGFPMMVDKIGAMIISVFLIIKGVKLFNENMEAASADHQAEHKLGEGGVTYSHNNTR
jgi:divalent metal cation (Fe/Co/Zn/Cd) transporter